MKKIAVGAAALAIAASASLSACSGSQHRSYQSICVNPYSNLRVLDLNCPPTWLWYVPYGYSAPAMGVHPASYIIHSVPNKSRVVYGGAPPAGGLVKPTAKPTVVNVPKPASTAKPKNGSTAKVNTTKPKNNTVKPNKPAPRVGGAKPR